MEPWSLMHFLKPHIFQSHQEFKDWFYNPISGMERGVASFALGQFAEHLQSEIVSHNESVLPCLFKCPLHLMK